MSIGKQMDEVLIGTKCEMSVVTPVDDMLRHDHT